MRIKNPIRIYDIKCVYLNTLLCIFLVPFLFCAAKLLLFFQMTKKMQKKMQKKTQKGKVVVA